MKTIGIININVVASLEYSIYEQSAFINILKEEAENNLFTDIDTFCWAIGRTAKEYNPPEAFFNAAFLFPRFFKCSPYPGSNTHFSLVIK